MRVSVENHHQAHALEVVPLGNHLRSHNNVNAAGVHRFKGRLSCRFAAHAVAVNTKDSRLRPERLNVLLNALRAGTHRQNFGVAAHGAAFGHTVAAAAVMAHQTLFRLVKHRKSRAVHAPRHPAAGRTADHRRITSPVDEDQHLTARFDGLRHRLLDLFGKDGRLAFGHIDELHVGQMSACHRTARQRQPLVLTDAHLLPGFQRRRRRPQHTGNLVVKGPLKRYVAS